MLPGLMSLDFCLDIQIESEFGVNRMDMDPSCLVTTVQAAGGGLMVWGMFFLAHFRPLSAKWASFKCHSLPEHCF